MQVSLAVSVFLLLSLLCTVQTLDEVALQTYLDTVSNSVYARPVKSPDDQQKVNVTFFLQQVIALNPNRIIVTGLIFTTWFDQRLTWNPATYDNAILTRRSVANVWTPQFQVTNSAGDTQSIIANNQNDQVTLLSTGQVLYDKKVLLENTCVLNMLKFPKDEQTCQLKLAISGYSYSQTKFSVEMNYDSIRDTYVNNTEWQLLSWANEEDNFNIAASPAAGLNVNFSRYSYTLKMTRVSYYSNLVYIMPVMLLSLLAILNFFLPAQSDEKISLGVNVILTFMFFLLLMDKFFSHAFIIPWLNIYLLIMLGLSAVMLYGCSAILRIYHMNAAYGAPSDALFNVFIRTFGTLLGHFGYGKSRQTPVRKSQLGVLTRSQITSEDDLVATSTPILIIEAEDEWRLLATVLDTIFSWIGLVAIVSISIGVLVNVF